VPTHASFCRFCHANCGILVDVEAGRARRVRGDPDNPGYRGFTCAKGRQLPEQHAHPDRLLRSLAKRADGSHESIGSERAMDEVAARVETLVGEHGPRAVAIYIGTFAGPHPAAAPAAVAWALGLGSRMIFTAASIDQPGKNIANALHGRWLGGSYGFDEADRWLSVGNNPLISNSGGILPDVGRRLRAARERGQQLVVVDPRRTELARFADVFLQPRPGQDPALLAGFVHVILRDGLHDERFLHDHTRGLEALREAVAPFGPAQAAARAGVDADDLERAAHVFASGRRGCAVAGTGPNMAGRGNLTEYLLQCLNTLCGYWRREGEIVANPGALLPAADPVAQPASPRPAWGHGEKLRVRGFSSAASGLPTAALADEILMEGEGRVRALVCIGSNPVAAWPDQLKTVEALRKLDLLVCLDMKRSETAKLAHYVIAPKLSLEVPGVSVSMEALEQQYVGHGYGEPYAQYTRALVDPPAGADVVEEWEFFYGLARRMGIAMRLFPLRAETGVRRASRKPVDLDMQRKPTTDALFDAMLAGSRVPLDEVRRHPHGAVFPDPPIQVAPRESDCDAHLEVGDETMLRELGEVAAEARDDFDTHPYRLISRRLPNVYNSSGRDLPQHLRREAYNPAFMHPDDLAALGVAPGSLVRITSRRASILGVARAEAGLRPGVVSMSHAFGALPGPEEDVWTDGSSTARLVDVTRDYDPYTGMPRMSAIPVRVEAAEGGA
jgi:anaerobic selenocysteine-containing dehydrogenase